MSYTLWLDQHLLGESDFEHPGLAPAQRIGALRPTAHGLAVLPDVCGFLSAASALKDGMERRGLLQENDVPDDAVDDVIHALNSTAEGQRFIEVVQRLAALELRAASGERLSIKSIVVSDLKELASLGGSFDADAGGYPENAPRFVISATLEKPGWSERPRRQTLPRVFRWRQ